jgi:drug/metabolite transporter (DMT)-like permease
MLRRLHLSLALPIATTVVLWGSAYAGIRVGLKAYSPAHVAVLRYVAAALVLGLVAVLTRMRLPRRRDLPAIFLLGLAGFTFYNLALNLGEQTVPAGPAALLVQTGPIWTGLLAAILLRERLRAWAWLGIGISFAGILLIGLGKGQSFQLEWAAGLIVLAALSMSIYNVLQKRMLARYRALEITSYAVWAGTLLLLPFAPGLLGEMRAAPLPATLAVIYLGAGPAALGYVTWALVLAQLPAGRAASFLYAVPVVAFLAGWIWLGEAPATSDLFGGLLALAGVVVVNTLGRTEAKNGFSRIRDVRRAGPL